MSATSRREQELFERYLAAMFLSAVYDDATFERLEGLYVNHTEFRGRSRDFYLDNFAESFDAYYLVFAAELLAAQLA